MNQKESIYSSQKIIDLYKGIIDCDKDECARHGALTWGNTRYHFPRAFYGEYASQKDILVVATNPGLLDKKNKLLKKIIDDWRGGANTDRGERNALLYEEHLKIVRNYFDTSTDSFHEPLAKALEYILQVPRSSLFDVINFTNIVKCSTCCDFGVLFREFKPFLLDNCVATHFQQELALLNPKIIILYIDKKSRKLVIDKLQALEFDPSYIINLPRAPRVKTQREEWWNIVKNLRKEYLKLIP